MTFKEDYTLELKERVNNDIKKEIVAFANSDGGEILIGINKSGAVIGVQNIDQEMERISNMIRDGIRPDLTYYTSVDIIKEGNFEIIKVGVQRGEKRPYHLSDKGLRSNGVYVRHGITAAPASEERIRQMIKESDGDTFDRMRSLNQQLNFDFATKYFQESNLTFTSENKRSLNLIDKDGYYTNAALLLSEQCEHTIKCAVYSGTDKMAFQARKEFSGSILQQLTDVYEYLDLLNNKNTRIESLKRVDFKDYPDYAIREALINSIVHRDYNFSGSILLNIYKDRVEFVSLGSLVQGITIRDMMHGVSQTRNTVIANVFYRLELIESYGTGVQRIMKSYDGELRAPSFSIAPASVVVTLPNRNYNSRSGSFGNSRNNTEAYGNINENLPRYGNVELTDTEAKVIDYIISRGQVTTKEIENLLQKSYFPVNLLLNRLIDKGVITRVGKARATKYKLAK